MRGFPIILLMISTKTGKASFGFPCREVDYPDTTAMNSSTSLRLPPHCRLKSNFIRKVYEDNFQRLWVVSEGGTDIIDLTTMQSVLPHDPRKKLETLIKQPAFMVTQDANGCIWLYCSNSLHRIAFRIMEIQRVFIHQRFLILTDTISSLRTWKMREKYGQVSMAHYTKQVSLHKANQRQP